jgi:N-acetylmuramic acid 6-phosphate etherase
VSVLVNETTRRLSTEDVNPRTEDIDRLSTLEILQRINDEDALVAAAVAKELPAIAAVVDRVVDAFSAGGRLIYVGSGTSGRLAVIDAAECPPTYGTPPSQVQAMLAGAPATMTTSFEGVEDDEAQAAQEVRDLQVGEHDVVLGVAASGATPYVVGALHQARALGAVTAALVASADGPVAAAADLVIAPDTGPEVIAGSTRMKAGTAQKLTLNMISTAAMIRTGRTFGNLMVDMQPRNNKLRDRSRRMVGQAAHCDLSSAEDALVQAGGDIKVAVLSLLANVSVAEAQARLAHARGIVRRALDDAEPASAVN